MPRIAPLPFDAIPHELSPVVERYHKMFGFVPNSVRTMARRPKIAKAFSDLGAALDASLTIPRQVRGLVFQIASHAAGCRYCQAHSISRLARGAGVSREKLRAIWDYESSPLFDEAERAAMRFAQAAGVVPNAVTDQHFADLRRHYDDDQIVEIMTVIALSGFLNRWNDTLGTELEPLAVSDAEDLLAPQGWTVGKHRA